jgi:hypothetical protein
MKIETEWTSGSGVQRPALAATWCRLIWSHDRTTFTTCDDGENIHRGVYGSSFPLIQWIVQNWWFLLHQPIPTINVGSPRFLQNPATRTWLTRHNLLFARQGLSLPDLTLYRDGDQICFQAIADPPEGVLGRSVRFINNDHAYISFEIVEHQLSSLIQRTLDRAKDQGLQSDEDVTACEQDWDAVLHSMETEYETCRKLAMLGVDPYGDETELPPSLLQAVQESDSWPKPFAEDFCMGSQNGEFPGSLNLVRRVCAEEDLNLKAQDSATVARQRTGPAFTAGYNMARELRTRLSIPISPLTRLDQLLSEGLQWGSDFNRTTDGFHGSPTLQKCAILAQAQSGRIRFIHQRRSRPDNDRFLLARAAFFAERGHPQSGPRMVTPSYDWDQQASRAFAAELLAPAEGIRNLFDTTVDSEQIDELAKDYQVSSQVIRLQIQNHDLAIIQDDS